MSQQSLRQASVRAVTGSAETYEGDWHKLFDLAGLATGSYDERLLRWINYKLTKSYTNLPEAMQAFAVSVGAANWDSIGTFSAGTGGGGPDAFAFVDQTSCRLSTQYTSAGVVLAGTGGPWAVTVTGGTASINGGSYSASPGNASPGDAITARGTSSGSTSTAVNVAVSVGTTSDTFTMTTVVNTEASDFLGRAVAAGATEPNSTRRGLYDTLITGLKSANWWNRLAGLSLAANEASTALLNIRQNAYNSTNNGAVFTQDRGFKGDGAAAWIDVDFDVSTTSTPYDGANSALLGAWVNQDGGGSSAIIGVSNGVALPNITPLQTSTARARMHTSTQAQVGGFVNRLGYSAGVRTTNTNQYASRSTNGTITDGTPETTAASTGVSRKLAILRNNTTYSLDRAAGWWWGGPPTSTADHQALLAPILTFLTAIGAQ